MKKNVGFILFLFSIIMSLTACGSFIRPLNGTMLDNMAAKKLAASDSYTATSFVNVKLLIDGQEIDISSDILKTVAGQNSKDPVIITDSEQMITYKRDSKTDITEKVWITEGYQDGYMFRTHFYDLNLRGKKSEISAKDYTAFLSKRQNSTLTDFIKSRPQKSELTQQENGDWQAVLSEFKSEFIYKHFREIVGSSLPIETMPTALTVTITTNDKYDYKSVVTEFTLENPQDAVSTVESLSVVTEYTRINSTDVEKENLDSCDIVSDLRNHYTIFDAVNALYDTEACELDINIDYKLHGFRDYNKTQNETGTLNYDKKGKLNYLLTMNDGDSISTVDYSDGTATKTVTYINNENTSQGNLSDPVTEEIESNDYVELSTIFSLLNYAEFSIDDIKEIKISEHARNTYILDVEPTSALLAKTGGEISSLTVTLTLSNGKITKYYTNVQGDGYYDGTYVTFTLKNETNYKEEK